MEQRIHDIQAAQVSMLEKWGSQPLTFIYLSISSQPSTERHKLYAVSHVWNEREISPLRQSCSLPINLQLEASCHCEFK